MPPSAPPCGPNISAPRGRSNFSTARLTGSGPRLRRDLGIRLVSIREALRNPSLGRLLLVWGVWVTTDWMLLITVSLLALDLNGPAAVGLIGAALRSQPIVQVLVGFTSQLILHFVTFVPATLYFKLRWREARQQLSTAAPAE